MSHSSGAFRRGIVIGAGAVGTLFVKALSADVALIQAFDIRPLQGAKQADAGAPGGELLAALKTADLVVLALPEAVTVAALRSVARHVPQHCLIVETTSVKTPLSQELERGALGRDCIGVNPLFGPSLGFAGQTVASIDFGSTGAGRDIFHQCLARAGARVVNVSASQHDEAMAVIQAALHAALLAFGGVLEQSGMPESQLRLLATPPFRALLLLIARVFAQNPTTYFDIQVSNPFARGARGRLLEQLQRIDAMTADSEGSVAFEHWFESVAARFGSSLPQLMQHSDALLSAVPRFKV
jgi:prephenate dehydrogenase